ncbi:unnamed protein product [Rotaria socialis]
MEQVLTCEKPISSGNIIESVIFYLDAYIGIVDKHATNIIIGSNRASSSTNIDNHPMILPSFFFINLLNRH